jgi:hypothetical protein
MIMKNYSDTIENRTRDLLACNDHLRHDVPPIGLVPDVSVSVSVRHEDRRINGMGLHIRRSFFFLIFEVLKTI